jgi:cytochrome c-type biogenesis protein CcmH/NrfG
MTQSDPTTPRVHVRRGVVAIVLALAVLLAVLALHLTAVTAAHRAQEPGSLARQADSARLAAKLEPWNAEYARRSRVLGLWELGQQQLDAGDYNGAVDSLRVAYRSDVGNTALLALFRRAQATQALATNRKAHLQHGHEGPGGTLRPEDIER